MFTESFSNEACRFATVRSPQALTQHKRQEHFIRYTADETQVSLYSTLRGILSNSQTTDNEKLQNVQLAAANYLKGESALATIAQLAVYLPNIAPITEQLATKGRAVKASDLFALWSLEGTNEAALRLRIWDTLIAANVLGGHLYAGEYLETALKMLHAAAIMTSESTEPQLVTRLNAHILLPNTIFPLPKVVAETPTPKSETLPKDKDPHKVKREKYEVALQEVRKYRSRKQILKGRNTNAQQGQTNGETPPPYIDIDDLQESNSTVFSNDTQAVLTDLMLEYPIRMADLIELLVMEIREMQPKYGIAGKRVMVIGGSIWEENRGPVYKGGAIKGGSLGGGDPVKGGTVDYDPIKGGSIWEEVPEGGEPVKGGGLEGGPLPVKPFLPIGVAELRIVEQELCCYKAGEIAHTEPVLQGESKERSTRRLDKTETFESSVVEKSKEEERDSQSTDRYELESESSKVANKDLSISSGMNLTASYGAVSLGANASFAFNSSSQVSNTESVNIAKEVTQRAVKRISEKIRIEKTTKTTFEFEELNVHKLENKGDGNFTGIYRWLDKYYKCRVRNYGKRTMYEFYVPRPAAFHIAAMSSQEAQSVDGILQPIDPRSHEFYVKYPGYKLTSLDAITEANYTVWASLMGIEITAPPQILLNLCYGMSGQEITSETQNVEDDNNFIPRQFASTTSEITVPEGYKPKNAWIDAQPFRADATDNRGHITVTIGNSGHYINDFGPYSSPIELRNYKEGEPLYVNVIGHCNAYTVGLAIELDRMPSHLAAWQMKVYNQIIATYEQKKAQYEMAIKAAKTRGGIEIKGTNPDMNREIERTELKKWCMMHLFPVGSVPGHPYDPEFSSWAMQMWSNLTPFFFSQEATNDGQRVGFAEGMFEWENMIYQFFPYYWSPEHYWKEIYTYQDTDPLFQKFMQAGYARVLVPVKPGYEPKVATFFATGIIPQSSSLIYDEETLAALIADMQDIPDPNDPDNIEHFTWEVKIPTSLVILQTGAGCVGDEGLPCYCDQVFTDTPPPPKPFHEHVLVEAPQNGNTPPDNHTPTE